MAHFQRRVAELFLIGKVPNCPEGVTMRALLANLLNCAPMRVSKKYTGELVAGKHAYRVVSYDLAEEIVLNPGVVSVFRTIHLFVRKDASQSESLERISGVGLHFKLTFQPKLSHILPEGGAAARRSVPQIGRGRRLGPQDEPTRHVEPDHTTRGQETDGARPVEGDLRGRDERLFRGGARSGSGARRGSAERVRLDERRRARRGRWRRRCRRRVTRPGASVCRIACALRERERESATEK